MNMMVISYKVCWYSPVLSSYVAEGGFPFQMQALSELFDQTTLNILERLTPIPDGAIQLTGKDLMVSPLIEPKGRDLKRKLTLLFWIPANFLKVWRAVRRADAVHSLVPGDAGILGILMALAQRKPLFIRHCGTWGEPVTLADRFTLWLLERIAGGSNVVMATGGAEAPPSARNPNIRWIFSTTLSEGELTSLPVTESWKPGGPLYLIHVGRLAADKNAQAVIGALPVLQQQGIDAYLNVVGGGEMLSELQQQARRLGVADQVTFHGNVDHQQVLALLAHSHLFVFPTRVKEGFPKAVLEAMACGLPVLATPVSVIPFLLRNGSGRLLEGTDEQAVALAILSICNDVEQMALMGAQARLAAQEYTLERWRNCIGERLQQAWSRPLKDSERP